MSVTATAPDLTSPRAPGRTARRTLPPTVAFVGAALAFAALYLAAGAPTPLLVVFERQWGFPASVLTIAFAAYSLGLLAALLVVGSLSDHLGLGALLTGAAVQFTAAANLIVFTALAVIMALGTAVTVLSAETVTPRPGAVRALVPQVTVPRAARREFAAAVPVHVGSWMLAGLFMGLVPTIIRDIFGIDSGLLNGATAFLEPAAAAVAGFFLGRLTPRSTTQVGGATVLAGTAIIVAGVALGVMPLLWVGGIVGGVGFGASFSGALRTITPLAAPHQRAGLFAAVFLVAYLAFGIPAIVAGLLVGVVGLLNTVLGYGVAIIAAAAVGLLAQHRVAAR